jgi:hypothetical protein
MLVCLNYFIKVLPAAKRLLQTQQGQNIYMKLNQMKTNLN